MIVIRARFRAFAVNILTADVTFANTLRASQKTTSILAKYVFALLALLIKTARNGGKGKIFKMKMKRNVIICVILAIATCALAYLARGLHL